jgi:hypothetical protein
VEEFGKQVAQDEWRPGEVRESREKKEVDWLVSMWHVQKNAICVHPYLSFLLLFPSEEIFISYGPSRWQAYFLFLEKNWEKFHGE